MNYEEMTRTANNSLEMNVVMKSSYNYLEGANSTALLYKLRKQ